MNPTSFTVTITRNGPCVVAGGVPLAQQYIVTDAQGESVEWREGDHFALAQTYALCRCGRSAAKPFCDGSHSRVGFDGTETASREAYDRQAERIEGPTMDLQDAPALCAFARFCDAKGQVWNLVRKSGEPGAAQLVEHEAGHCPGGRLVARHHAHEDGVETPFEPPFPPSIGLVQDPAKNVSGPIWVRGGIPVIGADGHAYEVRNRVALCRCGASSNKPFCDGTHASTRFTDQK